MSLASTIISLLENGQLQQGVDIEKEHDDVYDFIANKIKDMPLSKDDFRKMIVQSHLNEIPDYYTRLTKMEQEAKGE